MRAMSSRSTAARDRLLVAVAASSAKRTWKPAEDERVVVGVEFGCFVDGVVSLRSMELRSMETAADSFEPAPTAFGVVAEAEAAAVSKANEWRESGGSDSVIPLDSWMKTCGKTQPKS